MCERPLFDQDVVWLELQTEAYRFVLDVLHADGRAPFEQPQGKLHLL